ncbi:helix-turn-helix transcriptional regulator [Rubritalea tangerina]|uniref:Helix-turn-helix transcriptional regulator n=1 Tax=Rubritalea tangerina TaxID=430798 RepID=A0ABW4ZBS3_9BACT
MSSFGGGRTATIRMMKIFEAVKAGRYPNCRSLAEEFEVQPKTVQRDITYMRDQMGIELHYNQRLHGYEFQGEVEQFPLVDLQVEDLAALFLARSAMGGMQGTKLAEVLQPAFEKLSRQLDGKVSMRWDAIEEAFTVRNGGVVEADLTLFGRLAEAVIQQNEVSFRYRSLKDKTSQSRRMRPYHVGEISGGWYVIGYDIEREGLRTFALQRMVGVRVLKAQFERPADFNVGDYLGGSLGVWGNGSSGKAAEGVVIHVDGWVARLVQERLWHPSQKVKWLDVDGGVVEVTMQLENLKEVTQLMLSWGSKAKAVSPAHWVNAVRRELAESLERY